MTAMRSYLLPLLVLLMNTVLGQDNYEIQVYSSPTTTPHTTMAELHSNFTFNGEKNITDGVRPAQHALHETLEITQGVVKNFEIGFYLFTNYTAPYGYQFVGMHIRPRICVPEKWNWKLGASLSVEFGYQRKEYSGEEWSLEIRPILDKQFRQIYLSVNPVLGFGLKTTDHTHPVSFEPNIKASYCFKNFNTGIEYYGDLGPFSASLSANNQSHAIFFVADITTFPKWEINFGPGLGLTSATDRFVFKLIIGRRLGRAVHS